MTRVLVTGATGRVGSAAVEALDDGAVAVRVASRDPEGARVRFENGATGATTHEGSHAADDDGYAADRDGGSVDEDGGSVDDDGGSVDDDGGSVDDHGGSVDDAVGGGREFVEFDLMRPETWGVAVNGVDRLFLVLPPSVSVDAVREFVDAAVRVGTTHVVYLSILGAQKVPVLPHRRIERHVGRVAPNHTFLRAAYFMQNLTGIHRPDIVERDELFVPAGDGALGFVDARDVGQVAARAVEGEGHANEEYELTGPASLDFHEAAATFSDVLDRRITYPDPSRLAFARRMLARDVPLGMVVFMLAEYQVTRFGLSGRTTADVARALGREPTSLETFVDDHREAFAAACSA